MVYLKRNKQPLNLGRPSFINAFNNLLMHFILKFSVQNGKNIKKSLFIFILKCLCGNQQISRRRRIV